MQTNFSSDDNPAAFGRLSVETLLMLRNGDSTVPAAFGRLSVETLKKLELEPFVCSRLRAAEC